MPTKWTVLHTPNSQKVHEKVRCPRYSGDINEVRRETEILGENRVAHGRGRSSKEARMQSSGQGALQPSVNLHLVCYRWYRPPRTVICLGFPKQRWTGTPAYTGLFCLQLLESLLSVYYHRLPWVWWSQSRNTCPGFYSHIRWTPASGEWTENHIINNFKTKIKLFKYALNNDKLTFWLSSTWTFASAWVYNTKIYLQWYENLL